MKKGLSCIAIVLLFSIAPQFLCQVAALGQIHSSGQSGGHVRNLTGTVFDAQDQPVEKAVVYLKNMKSLVVKTYISDPDGSYRFVALPPNVDYEVYAEYKGARSDTKTLSAFDKRKQVNITLRIHASKSAKLETTWQACSSKKS